MTKEILGIIQAILLGVVMFLLLLLMLNNL